MALLTGAVGAVFGALAYMNSLVGEGWSRYFIILAGLFADNAIGEFTGLYAIEGLLSWVAINVFGATGFYFPVYYGVSSLLMLVIMSPLVFYALKFYTSD